MRDEPSIALVVEGFFSWEGLFVFCDGDIWIATIATRVGVNALTPVSMKSFRGGN